MKNVQGIIISNMFEELLNEMTTTRCMGSIPVGGRYRLIDFALSNFTNSNIENVGVLTRSHYQSLLDHLGGGREWDLSRKNDGLTIWTPMATSKSLEGEKIELVRSFGNILHYFRKPSIDYVLIVFSDLMANINLEPFIEAHKKSSAEVSVMYKKMEIPDCPTDSYNQYVIDTEDNGFAKEILINPNRTGQQNLFINIMIFNREYFDEVVTDCLSRDKFFLGHDILMPAALQGKMFTYEFKGYMARFNSMQSYFNANLALLDSDVRQSLFPEHCPIYTRVRDESPVRYGRNNKVKNSLLSDGCYIDGCVENSLLFRGVIVEPGTVVKNCVLMQGTHVSCGAVLENVITDKNVLITNGQKMIGSSSYPIYIKKNSVL